MLGSDYDSMLLGCSFGELRQGLITGGVFKESIGEEKGQKW